MPKGLISLSVSLSSSTNLQDMILLCLLHSLQIHAYRYMQKLYHRNSYFKGGLGHCLRIPERFSSGLSLQVLLQSRKDSVWQEPVEDFQKEQTHLVTHENDSGTGSVPPVSQVIHHQHCQRMPGGQVFHVLGGNHALLYICWFHVLAREAPSERETRTGLSWEQQVLREDLPPMSNVAQSCPCSWLWSCSPVPEECSNRWDRKSVLRGPGGWSYCVVWGDQQKCHSWNRSAAEPCTESKNTGDRETKGGFESGEGGLWKGRGRNACGLLALIKNELWNTNFGIRMSHLQVWQKKYFLPRSQK